MTEYYTWNERKAYMLLHNGETTGDAKLNRKAGDEVCMLARNIYSDRLDKMVKDIEDGKVYGWDDEMQEWGYIDD